MLNNRLKVDEKDIKSTNQTDSMQTINGHQLKLYIEAALCWLRANQQLVNSLNVFPVPDGDTGTNMLLTMQAAYNEIANSDEENIGKVAKKLPREH